MSTRNPDHSDKATRFPEPGAANLRQYEEAGPKPEPTGPAPRSKAGERKPTQYRDREEHQVDPDGIVKTEPIEDTENADGADVAVTPGETVRAFGNTS